MFYQHALSLDLSRAVQILSDDGQAEPSPGGIGANGARFRSDPSGPSYPWLISRAVGLLVECCQHLSDHKSSVRAMCDSAGPSDAISLPPAHLPIPSFVGIRGCHPAL